MYCAKVEISYYYNKNKFYYFFIKMQIINNNIIVKAWFLAIMQIIAAKDILCIMQNIMNS